MRTWQKQQSPFICLDNAAHEVSLERRQICVALSDAKAVLADHIRVIAESGEDYLYPAQRFGAAELPVSTRPAVLRAAQQSVRAIARRRLLCAQEGIGDGDKSASFFVSEASRRSTSPLGGTPGHHKLGRRNI
jgi:hypothetical protein